MKKFLALSAVSAAALAATPAAAQFYGGPRVEVLGGWDKIKATLDEDKLSGEGLVYGIGAGYDFGMGGVMLGIDAEATKSDVKIVETVDLTRYRVDAGRDLYVGGRVSFMPLDSTILYLKGGYTRLRARASVYDASDAPDLELIGRASDHLSGWRVGAGASFTNGTFYGGPEFRYSNYEHGVTRKQALLVAGIRFGARPAEVVQPVIAPEAPAPAPATQTCPDGSVILATDACPVPPPPAPAPSGERG